MNKLTEKMKKQRLNVYGLAYKANLSVPTIYKAIRYIENKGNGENNLKINSLDKIANALNTTTRELLG